MNNPRHVVITGAKNFLAHTPGLVRYGSKPIREIDNDPLVLETIKKHSRKFNQAVSYPPNQVYIGGMTIESLIKTPQPWYSINDSSSPNQFYGTIMPEEEFLAGMSMMDKFNLIVLEKNFSESIKMKLSHNGDFNKSNINNISDGISTDEIKQELSKNIGSLPLELGTGELIGYVKRAHDLDQSLSAEVILENLACKVTAVFAVLRLLNENEIDPHSIDYVINSGEEAVGDRYQRGGGNLAKAIAEDSGCVKASGSDTKAFCCGPSHAIMLGSALISSGIYNKVLIVGGCSLTKLGMKFQGHVLKNMPILEDVLAGTAILLEANDGVSPMIRLDSIGKHSVEAGGSQAKVLEELVSKPLLSLGLKFQSIDKYATELHNPEVTEPSGSGNVPLLNYKLIAALAVRKGEINKTDMETFVRKHGLPGFSPTQGHLASAIPFMPHALDGIIKGQYDKVMFLAKGSLFLGRMTEMSDGLSFIIQANN